MKKYDIEKMVLLIKRLENLAEKGELHDVQIDALEYADNYTNQLIEGLPSSIWKWFQTNPVICDMEIVDVYLSYLVWCTQYFEKPVSKIIMGKSIKKFYGYEGVIKTINGKSCRVYKKCGYRR